MINKVYLLYHQQGVMFRSFGCVSDKEVAIEWRNIKPQENGTSSYYNFREYDLNNPEILNRIAKESKKNKK